MRFLLHFQIRLICVVGVLALPTNNDEVSHNSGGRSIHSNKTRGWLSPQSAISLMTERTPLSKVMRRAMLRSLFNFRGMRLQIGDVIVNSDQTADGDGSKKEYENGKRGGENEFEEIRLYSVEHSKDHVLENMDVLNDIGRIGEKEKESAWEFIHDEIQNDQQTGFETNSVETVHENIVDSSQPEIPTTTAFPKCTTPRDIPADDMFLESTSTCDHVTGYYKHRWLRLVVKCPSQWTNKTVSKQCDSWDQEVHGLRYIDEITMLPVQDSLGTVYANAFCAICHKVYPIYPWTTVLQCDAPTHYKSDSMPLTNISDLNLSFLQTFHENSYCKRIVMPSLPASVERCENHRLWPKGIYFRSSPLESLGVPSSFPVNFNVLMNFDFTGETHILFSAGQHVVQNEYVRRCDVGETFDTYSNRCRPVRCGSSHRLEAGKCVPIEDSMNGETVSDDFDVSALHETVKVSLSVNISFGLYLIFKEQDDLDGIVANQIAENLNISADRIKHINVSFDFGSINKTGYQVQKLSQEKYREYFPNDTDTTDYTKPATIIDAFEDKGHLEEHSSKHRQKRNIDKGIKRPPSESKKEWKSVIHFQFLKHTKAGNKLNPLSSSKSSKNHSRATLSDPVLDKISRMKKRKVTKKKAFKNSWEALLAELIDHKFKTMFNIYTRRENGKKGVSYRDHNTTGAKNSNEIHSNPSKDTKNRPKRTNELEGTSISKSSNKMSQSKKVQKVEATHKPTQWHKVQELSFNHTHSNSSNWDVLWSLLQPLGDQGYKNNQSAASTGKPRQSSVNSNATNVFNTENKIYLSPPLNKENDRMILGANSEIDFDQPMAMRISFILVPPDDPGSDEEQAMALLKKISDLIIDREFTLLVSGNEVSVVNSDDPEQDEEKANQFCPWGVMFIVYDDEFSILEIDNITMLYVNKTKTYHGIGRFDLWVMVKGKNSAYETSVTNLKEYAFVCFMPRIIQEDCQRITLKPDEYKVMSADNRSILFEENEYNITTYSVLNETSGEIQICVPKYYDPNKGQIFPHYYSVSKGCGSDFDDVRNAEGYLTLILGRVSIAAQALVLLTYFLFPSLRNLPGCNIMNLTLALFIAETIFEEGMLATTEWRCVTVAISLHFFFLASHFWMNVMSFDVYRAFSKPNISTSSKADKLTYFPKYFLYAWGMPAIIIGICSFIEFSDLFTDVSIGYGGTERKNRHSNITFIYSNFLFGDQQNIIQDVNIIEEDVINQRVPTNQTNNNITFTNSLVKESQTACWIQNPLASLLTFGAPILLIFILNCIFFTRTIINISRTVKLSNENLYRQHSGNSNSSYSKRTGRSEAKLYLRMSTVMGFTWVFGFSSAIISSVSDRITTTICLLVHIHSILFVIFNISQGLFIFVAFVCNRRVLRLYAGLFFRVRKFWRRQSHKSKIYSISSTHSTSSFSTSTSTVSTSS